MANRPTKKEARTRTPPEKKKPKSTEQYTLPLQEETEPATRKWTNRYEMQELAINFEDLVNTHPPRSTKVQIYPASSQILIRKYKHKVEKNGNVLVAHQQCSEYAARDPHFSGIGIPLLESCDGILQHNILGTLQDLKADAASTGNTKVPQAVTMNKDIAFGNQFEKLELNQRKSSHEQSPKQNQALNNWQRHMALRKKQLDSLSHHLCLPAEKLIMNTYEDFWLFQEHTRLIYRSIPATEYCKGMHSRNEFRTLPEYIGDDLTGLLLTVSKSEHGCPLPHIYVGKPKNILLETGLQGNPLIHSTLDKSKCHKQREYRVRTAMEKPNYSKLEQDCLEVIGQGKCFTYVTADSFGLSNEAEDTFLKQNRDALQIFPDMMTDIVFGPSLLFCGRQAYWIESALSHRDKVVICAHVTFEARTGEKVLSTIEVVNNGSTAIWYEWRRLPSKVKLGGHHKIFQIQHFFFSSYAGVLLPGKTQVFPFYFKSATAGIFMEDWEFCTHPVLLAGSLLHVSLWGIALHEDKVSQLREAVEKQLIASEAAVVVQKIIWELLEYVCTADRSQSPRTCLTEDIFNFVKPKTLNCAPDDETTEMLHFHLNMNICQSSIPTRKTVVDILQQACLQLWREGIDNLVERSQLLHCIIGIPNMDASTEFPVGEPADQKYFKESKEEKKGIKLKEEKGTPTGKKKEDKRGVKTESFYRPDKEEFSDSQNGNDESQSLKPVDTTQLDNIWVPSNERFDLRLQDSQFVQVDSALQDKYVESLYTEVYGFLLSMVRNLVVIADSLDPIRPEKEQYPMDCNNN